MTVDIAVRKRFGPPDLDTSMDGAARIEAVDELVELLEEIGELLAGVTRLTTYDSAVWSGAEIRTPWMPDHLRQQHQYTGILRVTYVVDPGSDMIGVRINIFWDTKPLEQKVQTATFKNLGHAAASMRKTAIESILFTKQIIGYFTITTRKGKRKRIKIYKPSPEGTPVHGHVNRRFFHRAIQYNVTPMQLKRPASAVIGPTRSRVVKPTPRMTG